MIAWFYLRPISKSPPTTLSSLFSSSSSSTTTTTTNKVFSHVEKKMIYDLVNVKHIITEFFYTHYLYVVQNNVLVSPIRLCYQWQKYSRCHHHSIIKNKKWLYWFILYTSLHLNCYFISLVLIDTHEVLF